MARRGRGGDEIKRFVEVLRGTNTQNIVVNDPAWTLVQGVTDAPTFSSHSALVAYGASSVPVLTAPRSAMYRIRISGAVYTSFPPAAAFGEFTTLQVILMNTPKTSPTPLFSFPPVAAPVYKLTAAGSSAIGTTPFLGEVFVFLNAGEDVGFGLKCFYSGGSPGVVVYIAGTTITAEFVTDSRRTGSY